MILETQPSRTMSIFGGILYEIFVCVNNLRDYFENGIMVVIWPKVQALVPFQMCCCSFFSSTVEVR